MIKIRREIKEDYEEIYKLIKKSFQTAEHSDGNEQDLVTKLRKSKSFIPELALLAETQGKIVGYIMFTKVNIGNNEEIALAPLAVLPEYQKQGVGSKLIIEGHKIAKDLGYNYSIVVGSEKYYPKFGYVPANIYKIQPPFDIDYKNFMLAKLNEKQINISGTLKYAEEFEI